MSAKKTSAKTSPSQEPAGYAEALGELEAILSEINDPKVDVDVLTDRVGRASFLIAWCKERISSAEFSVNEIVATLGDDDDFDDDELDDEEYDDEDDFDDEELDDDEDDED
jgi:exodeoxyribonuclease VII small subunit